MTFGIKPASGKDGGSVSRATLEKDTAMGLSALLIATALSLTMMVAVADLP